MNYSEAGKGSAPRKQANNEAYRNNYDLIFKKPKSDSSPQAQEDAHKNTNAGFQNEE